MICVPMDVPGVTVHPIPLIDGSAELNRVEFDNVPASGFLAWMARAEAISSITLNQAEVEKVQAGVLKGYVTLLPASQGNTGAPQ